MSFDEQRPDDAAEMQHTNAAEAPLKPSESMPEPQLATVDNATIDDDSYPNFHVTYWMFYPYSQVC